LIVVPYERLGASTLRAVVEEFVLREGTDYGDQTISLDTKVTQVERQLQRGEVVITYDESLETCTLMRERDYRSWLQKKP
jgi:uncharacterized protein YheU (UPF0270 family)